MRLAVLLVSVALPVALLGVGRAEAQSEPAKPPYGELMRDAGPFVSLDSLVAWAGGQRRRPAWAGLYADPIREGAPEYLFAVGRDSSVWIQGPGGQMLTADAYVVWQMGLDAAEAVGYDTLRVDDVGYGVSGGELYLDVRQSAPVVGVLLVLGLLGIGAVVALVRLRKSLAQSEARGRQLAESRRRLADSREAERLRLARELHDGPLQDLQAVRMRLGMAEMAGRRAESTPPAPIGEAVGQAQAEVLRVIGELREISEGLRPAVLGSFGLGPALRALTERIRPAHPDLDLRLDLGDDGADLSDPVRLALYRVAQEALSNALRHGQPSQINVAYAPDSDGGVVLAIEDDGEGFTVPDDLHDLEREGHLGLAGMDERVESIGGALGIESRPGRTRLDVRVPASALVATPSSAA